MSPNMTLGLYFHLCFQNPFISPKIARFFFFFFEMESCCVGHRFSLCSSDSSGSLRTCDPPASVSQSPGITRVHDHAWHNTLTFHPYRAYLKHLSMSLSLLFYFDAFFFIFSWMYSYQRGKCDSLLIQRKLEPLQLIFWLYTPSIFISSRSFKDGFLVYF